MSFSTNTQYKEYARVVYKAVITESGLYKVSETPDDTESKLEIELTSRYIGVDSTGQIIILSLEKDEPLNKDGSTGSQILLDGVEYRAGGSPAWEWTTKINNNLGADLKSRAESMLSIRKSRAEQDGVDYL